MFYAEYCENNFCFVFKNIQAYIVTDKCLVIFEDDRLGARARDSTLSGSELASLMKIGTKVVRGKDWKWGDQVRYRYYIFLLLNTT